MVRTPKIEAAKPGVAALLLALAVLGPSSVGCRHEERPAVAGAEPDPTPVLTLPDESGYEPSPADGGGSVRLDPVVVRSGEPCTLSLTYTAGERGIAAGGGVLCSIPRFWYWGPPQSTSPELPGYTSVVCSDSGVDLSVGVDRSNLTVLASVADGRLEPGDTVRFVYGDTSGGAHPRARGRADAFAEREQRIVFTVDGDGDGFFVPIADQPTVRVLAGPAARLVCVAPSRVSVGERFEVRLSVLDEANNVAEGHCGEVEIAVDGAVLEGGGRVSFATQDRGSLAFGLTAVAEGLARVGVADPDGVLAPATSNVIVVSEPAAERYQLLWADLHIHGNLSDGTGTPEELYRYAREVAGLDAAAVTEHDHWGYLPIDEHPGDWQRVCDATDAAYDVGGFVTFYGYEWTNWTFGHQHLLFASRDDAVVRAWNDPASDRPEELFAAVAGADCVLIPHHPGGGPVPTCWTYHDEALQPVVEIASVHGISERMGQAGGIYSPVASGMVVSALARGYRLGLIGGGDTHDGHPGIGSPSMPPPGLAGIWAEEASREAVLAALRARRVYATTGCRPIIHFWSEEVAMGGVIRARAEPPAFDLAVVGDADLSRCAVVKNGRHQSLLPVDGALLVTSWEDPEGSRPGGFYYLRVEDENGCTAWSSPIWVE